MAKIPQNNTDSFNFPELAFIPIKGKLMSLCFQGTKQLPKCVCVHTRVSFVSNNGDRQ